MRRPNILLLYTDQQRWDTIRYAGNTYIHTPNFDRLARSGVLFENAFCNNPVCMPSRQSMLSGQYPSAIGRCCNGIEMSEEIPTLATLLQPYGYHSANIGKLHFKNHSNRDHREPHPSYGFDTLILSDEPGCYDDAYIKWVAEQDPDQVENCRCDTPPAWTGPPIHKHPRNTHQPYLFDGPEHLTHTAFVASETIDFIQQHKDQPFFCIAGFYAPHTPLNPPKRFVEMYNQTELPLPYMNEGENTLGLSDEEWQKVKAYYYALITHVDDQIGRILQTLEDTGLREQTIVIFTSDHGEHLGDHGRIQKGAPGYDSCTHVPLLVSYPTEILSERKLPELIEAVDIAPTILDYCGIRIPPIFQGRSFRPLLQGDSYQERESVFIEYRHPFGISWKTIRTHSYKYCVSNEGEELLFDLKSDPHELRNVSGQAEYQDILHQAREELIRRWFTVEKQYPLRSGQY